MAGKFHMGLLVMVVVAALLHGAAAATYEVGDALGWTIPAGGSTTYTTWAANKNFTVGDILVFNFTSGQHDVAEVTKTAYDGCTATNPISLQTTSPSNITLSSAGEHYYICTFGGHCSAGQKLSINVTGASSPAPQPTTPPPTTTPAPVPVPTPSLAPQPTTTSPPPSATPTPTPTPTPAPTPSSTTSPPSSTAPRPAPTPSVTTSPPPSATPPTSISPPPPTTSSTSPPTTTTTTPPPPPPNSATLLGVPGFSIALLFVAMVVIN